MQFQIGGTKVVLHTDQTYHSCFEHALSQYVPGDVLSLLEEQNVIKPVQFVDDIVYYAIDEKVFEKEEKE